MMLQMQTWVTQAAVIYTKNYYSPTIYKNARFWNHASLEQKRMIFFRLPIKNISLGWIRFDGEEEVCLLSEVQQRLFHQYSLRQIRKYLKYRKMELRRVSLIEKNMFRRNGSGTGKYVLNKYQLNIILLELLVKAGMHKIFFR